MATTLDWHRCYGRSWTGTIAPESFAHPAKFSRALICRIYAHAFARGWLKAGDTVIDPFAGVGLGALEAMRRGLHWVGVELEEKFVKLGWQNIDLWNGRYGPHLPGWGSAVLLQGDSRELGQVVAGAGGCVSSPPYAGGCAHTGGNDPNPEHIQGGKYRSPGIAGAISSPPYTESLASDDPDKRGGLFRDPKRRNDKTLTAEYGQSDGQLGRMAEGEFDAALSSPPWEESLDRSVVDAAERRQFARSKGISNAEHVSPIDMERIGKRNQPDYSIADGQLGAMKGGFKAAVSSPPFENSMDSGQENTERRAERTGGFSQGQKHFTYGKNRYTFLSKKDPSGLSNDQRAAIAAQNPQVGALGGDTFWEAARTIVEQTYQVLRPGAVAIWIVKAFIRDKKRVDFPGQWQQLCEACGFETLEWIRAWLVEDRGAQYTLEGELDERKVEHKSFFRRLAENKGSPRIDYEVVLVMRKGAAHAR